MSTDEKFQNHVENALIFLEAKPSPVGGRVALPLNYFSRAMPFLKNNPGQPPEGFVMLPQDVRPEDLQQPDVCWMGDLHANDDSSRITGASIVRVSKQDRKKLRGKVPPPVSAAHAVFRVATAMIEYRTSQYEALHIGYFSFMRDRWWRVGETPDGKPGALHKQDKLAEMMQLGLSVAFTMESFWTVDISSGSGSLRFPTDPVGARELFKLREVKPGRSRRSALTHWVQAHSRKSRTRDAYHEVSKHLRSKDTFAWHGLNCKITPSLDDLRLYEKEMAK